MKEIKSLKGKTLRRRGYITLGDMELPIHTQGFMTIKEALSDTKKQYNIPKKKQPATAEEVGIMKSFGFDTKANKTIITRVDETSDEFIKFKRDINRIELFIRIAMSIDLTYPVGDIKLWEDLELKNENDIQGVMDWINGLDMTDMDYKQAVEEIINIEASNIREYEEWEKRIGS